MVTETKQAADQSANRIGTGWITRGLEPGHWLHRIWWHFSDYGEMRLWRPVCWIRGYHVPHHTDVHFENCYLCWKPLWSRSRDGGTNPYWRPAVDQAALTRRGRRAFTRSVQQTRRRSEGNGDG